MASTNVVSIASYVDLLDAWLANESFLCPTLICDECQGHVYLTSHICQYICENWCVSPWLPATHKSERKFKDIYFLKEETWFRWCTFEVFLYPGNDVLEYPGMSCISLVNSANRSLNYIYIEDPGNHVMERSGIVKYILSAINDGLECTRHPHYLTASD